MKKLMRPTANMPILLASGITMLMTLFGCAPPPPPPIQLIKSGANYIEFSRDAVACTQGATQTTPSVYSNSASYSSTNSVAYLNCMIGKGWRQVSAGGYLPLSSLH